MVINLDSLRNIGLCWLTLNNVDKPIMFSMNLFLSFLCFTYSKNLGYLWLCCVRNTKGVVSKALGNYVHIHVSNLAKAYVLVVFTKAVHTWTRVINEQTCSLQLSDSVYLWASWVWQAIHRIFVSRGLKDNGKESVQ